jgi:hypothetical protein
VSVLLLVLRNPWARYPVIVVEALAMASGVVALVTSGAPAGPGMVAGSGHDVDGQ